MRKLIAMIKDIKLRNWLWRRVRKSYAELHKHLLAVEALKKQPKSCQTEETARNLYMDMAYDYSLVSSAQFGFEELQTSKWVAPTREELAIYTEYRSAAIYRKNKCLEAFAELGVEYR